MTITTVATITTRRCSKCQQHKVATVEFFTNNRKCRLGITHICKVCTAASILQWRRANPDGALTEDERTDLALTAERKRINRICNTRGCENPLQPNTKGPRCTECAYTMALAAKENNPEAYHVRKTRDKVRRTTAYQENPEQFRQYARKARRELRAEFLAAYGGKCTCCGEAEPVFLTLEHVQRDGRKHRELVGTSHQVLADLRRRGWPSGLYTILCFNCNRARWTLGVCPHQEKEKNAATCNYGL